MDANSYRCEICNKPVLDYVPVLCCNGSDCCCRGGPIEPCLCSENCADAMYKYIGVDFEERRVRAGIELYKE